MNLAEYPASFLPPKLPEKERVLLHQHLQEMGVSVNGAIEDALAASYEHGWKIGMSIGIHLMNQAPAGQDSADLLKLQLSRLPHHPFLAEK